MQCVDENPRRCTGKVRNALCRVCCTRRIMKWDSMLITRSADFGMSWALDEYWMTSCRNLGEPRSVVQTLFYGLRKSRKNAIPVATFPRCDITMSHVCLIRVLHYMTQLGEFISFESPSG